MLIAFFSSFLKALSRVVRSSWVSEIPGSSSTSSLALSILLLTSFTFSLACCCCVLGILGVHVNHCNLLICCCC